MAEAPAAGNGTPTALLRPPLLTTKLYIPFYRPNLVPRPRLLARLNEGLTGKLTLISAPVGFGKTTLLCEWIQQLKDEGGTPYRGQVMKDEKEKLHPSSSPGASRSAVLHPSKVAWVSLDEGDNDPTRFWVYLMSAVQILPHNRGENALMLLQSPQPPPLELILTTWLNELTVFPDHFALVLDDFHLIENSAIHAAMTFLLDHLPSHIHLIVTTRADPPWPLARLRVRGQLTELRAADLRFTPDEATAFLNDAMGLSLTASDITVLEERTEGWIAGLQLAALSMQGRHDLPRFIQAFTGSHSYIVDYLAEEVLQRQSERVQTFLLQTSLLERLCGPLCDAVLKKDEGRTPYQGQVMKDEERAEESSSFILHPSRAAFILEQLERANLFIIPLDDERRWYRYHPLFADLLRQRLQQLYPDLAPELHRRASVWYAQAGLVAEAIRHALAAGDVAGAAALIEEAAMTVLWSGQVSTMISWLETLPAVVVRARPRLSLAQAWGLVLTGPIEAVEARLQDVEQSLGDTDKWASQPATERESLLGQVTALRALVALNQNDLGRAISLCQQALTHLPPDNTLVRGLIAYNLGHAERQSGHGDSASRAFGEAMTLGQSAGNLMLALYAVTSLAELAEVRGQLHQAARTYDQALHLATVRDGQPLPLAGAAYVGLGKVWREWNDLVVAADHLAAGIDLGQRGGVEGIILDGSITLALVRQAQGDGESAHMLIRQAAQLAQKWKQPATIIRVAAFEARLWLAQGQLEPALRWMRESGVSMDDEPREPLEIEHATLARILLAQGAWDEARWLLDRLLPVAEAAGRLGRVVEILALQALMFQGRGEFDPALFTLERALHLAEPGGYIRIFADEGAPMATLLKRMKDEGGGMKEYIHKLLAAFDAEVQGSRGAGGQETGPSPLLPRSSAPLLIDPLSERELEVLHLIAEGLSNREIAEQLIISFGTVRKHVENIRSKLGVTSRLQAVNQARAWGLL